jgi:hypothetical protein
MLHIRRLSVARALFISASSGSVVHCAVNGIGRALGTAERRMGLGTQGAVPFAQEPSAAYFYLNAMHEDLLKGISGVAWFVVRVVMALVPM